MTALSTFLENFSQAQPNARHDPGVSVSEVEMDSLRLESFETGYRAGWDDAIKAQSDDRTRISSSFGQHLQDLSFTYHEAYSHVMNAMAPLLDDMVNTLLPKTVKLTLGQHIVDQIHEAAKEIGALEVVIAVSPDNSEAVGPLLEGEFAFPIRLIEDDTLSDEQADIRFGETEKQIDLSALLQSVAEAVGAFAHDNRRKAANG